LQPARKQRRIIARKTPTADKKNNESASWFIAIKHMLRKYDLKEASWYLDNPVKKTILTSIVKKTVYSHWNGSIIQLLPLYKGLNLITAENLETGKIHPLFKINCHSAIDTVRLSIKLKLLTGMYKNEIDPKYVLCAKEEENIEHFILNCKSLSKVGNTILQELITTFNTLGIEFDELSANEKLQHILDVTHFYSIYNVLHVEYGNKFYYVLNSDTFLQCAFGVKPVLPFKL
jgi:hypothetical protein